MSESAKKPIAVVTGSGGAIGGAIAAKLASEGYLVALTDINESAVKARSATIAGSIAKAVDLRNEEEVIALRNFVHNEFGIPSLLVNAAGVFFEHKLVETTVEQFDLLIDVNLRGTFLTCKTFIPEMISAGGGSIVNISSTAGLHASSTRPIYSVAKAGVIMLTRSITVDYGAQGIRANVICPGLIDTPMADWITSRPEALKAWAANLPAGRIGTVDDIAKAVSFLASDESSYMHAGVMAVDGGGRP
ncbi:MAG: SDR family oxidoreductase [Actinomycetes bacterium]